MTNDIQDDDKPSREQFDFVRIGQHSRESARLPIHVQASNASHDVAQLTNRKREIESELSRIRDEAIAESAKVAKGRYRFEESRGRYFEIKAKENAAASVLKKELRQIEGEILELKRNLPRERQITDSKSSRREELQQQILHCLLRIEKLLIEKATP